MLESECDQNGNLLGNHRPVLLADIKRQEAARRKAEAALAPKQGKAQAVVRWYMHADGSIQPFGRGPVTFEKWACQVYGENDPRLVRPECTEEQFAEWKAEQGYKQREAGAAGGPKVRDELADMKAQLAAAQAAQAKQTALLEQLLAAQQAAQAPKGSSGKGKQGAE
jgi:hypothetical protein